MTETQKTLFLKQQSNQWNTWFGYATDKYPVMLTEFGWEPCETPLVAGECQNHPSGGKTTLYGDPIKSYVEKPFYTMPPRLPKVVGWTVWVADYCLGPRMLDQATRSALDGTNEQGQFIKTWLYEKRTDYFPTPTATITPSIPLTADPEPYPAGYTDCEYDAQP